MPKMAIRQILRSYGHMYEKWLKLYEKWLDFEIRALGQKECQTVV